MTLRPYQQEAVDRAVAWMRRSVEPACIELPTGCHEKGHPILMADGSIKPVEHVSVGDLVMGDDSTPRKVIRLHRGREDMFRITPTKGESFVVNGGHILSLYITPARKHQCHGYVEISVFDYLKKSNTFKHRAKLQRCSIEMPERSLPIPPYIVGVLIGDGHFANGHMQFSCAEKTVINAVSEWASSIGCEFKNKYSHEKNCYQGSISDPLSSRTRSNAAKTLLERVGAYGRLAGRKYVPHSYKTGSTNQRLEMLAGLLDTDGSMSKGGFDWISKSELLADDVVYLCRSVGLAAYKTVVHKSCQTMRGVYYRVSISGDCSVIPIRVARKRAPKREKVKRVDVTGFKVEPVAPGEYFGFELDGNHLYLDGYFVRHHNSGKSWIAAHIADWVHETSGKKVLCLQPSAELTEQNWQKYQQLGSAGIFSSSLDRWDLRQQVIYGTPQTVLNRIDMFGAQFGAVIVDECHWGQKQIHRIIEHIRKHNRYLRVIGMTATPYRTARGYIYQYDEDGEHVEAAHEPYYNTLLYRITARALVDDGYLTPPTTMPTAAHYDTSALVLGPGGRFRPEDEELAYEGHGRLTSEIVADVVRQSARRMGVMIFAATVQHAHEVMASLPPDNARMVGGDTNTAGPDRRAAIEDFKAQRYKYLVSVGMLTTGFDAPHVDVIAVLRKTESPGLFQQIIGRGTRLYPDKADCMILDYAGNIEFHGLEDDLFDPEIRAQRVPGGEAKPVRAVCPQCGFANQFLPRQDNPEGFGVDLHGYLTDLSGERVEDEHGPTPAHYGRRCTGQVPAGGGRLVRCDYRWTEKECYECQAGNDIAARYCEACKAEIIDPNERLRLEYTRIKEDPYQVSTDEVLEWAAYPHTSQAGNPTVRCEYRTEWRKFTAWYTPQMPRPWASLSRAVYKGRVAPNVDVFLEHLDTHGTPPKTVTYHRQRGTKFYRVLDHNRPADAIP